MKGKILLLVGVLFSFCMTVEAAKLDTYRKMMENHSFTLKYEIEVPDNYLDGVEMFVKDGKSYPIWYIDLIQNSEEAERLIPPYQGIIVVSGDNKFAEVVYKGNTFAYRLSREKNTKATIINSGDGEEFFLQKNGEKFFYGVTYMQTSLFGGRNKKYVGVVGNKVEIGKIEAGTYYPNPQEAMRREYNYGHPIIGRILHAIYTDGNLPVEYAPPAYEFVDSGRLDDGLFYEDYTAEQNNKFYAMRFFFDGDTLAKVSSVSYKQTANGQMDEASYQTKTVHIKEFSSVPDVSYLSLPEGLKDVTKRGKAKAGEDE